MFSLFCDYSSTPCAKAKCQLRNWRNAGSEVKGKKSHTNICTCELINSLYFISSNGLPGIEMEFTSCLCLIGSATLGLILLVWGVFELDYSIVGPGYCFSGFDKTVCGGLCASVCVLSVCVCVCVFSLTTESAETTDSPTGALSKSLCMQIKNATINVAKEQGGHAGFMASSTRYPPSLSLSLVLPLSASSKTPPGFDVAYGRSWNRGQPNC